MYIRIIVVALLMSLCGNALAGQADELTSQRVQDDLTIDPIPEDFHTRPLTTVLEVDSHSIRTLRYGRFCEEDQVYYECPIYEEIRVHPAP